MKIDPVKNRRPTFVESSRRRPLWRRLTPVAWITIGVAVFLVAIAAALVVTSISRAVASETVLAEVYRPYRPAGGATAPNTSGSGAAIGAPATRLPSPTPAPTLSPSPAGPRAPWADRMRRMPDGTWMAPDEVVRKAISDQNERFMASRRRATDRKALQADLQNQAADVRRYFTGEALESVLSVIERKRREGLPVTVNTGGTWLIEVKDFSRDGLVARMGVVQRDWKYDELDPETLKPIKRGQTQPDYLSISLIRYDPEDGRWKIEKFLQTIPLNPPPAPSNR